MQRNRLAIAAAFALVLVLGLSYTALTQQSGTQINDAGYRDISSEELNAWMANKDFILINVHIPYEGEIEETDIFIPYDKISENLDMLPADKTGQIVVYCMSGRMSAIAATDIVQKGYTNIVNLDGGMRDWEKSGFTLLQR